MKTINWVALVLAMAILVLIGLALSTGFWGYCFPYGMMGGYGPGGMMGSWGWGPGSLLIMGLMWLIPLSLLALLVLGIVWLVRTISGPGA